MNYLETIKKEIEQALECKTPGGLQVNFSVEIAELDHGDVTSNFCLVASKVLKMSPQEVFEKVAPHLTSPLKKGGIEQVVERFEFKNPGFVNFYFKKEYVQKVLESKNERKSFFSFLVPHLTLPINRGGTSSSKYFGRKVLVEFTSINLFKPFNIGHLMSNFTGEYISRSLESLGAKVIRISYPSDISIGIAKAIYIIKNDGGLGQLIFQKENAQIVKYLGECYVRGVAEYKKSEDEKVETKIQEIKEIANKLYNKISGEDLEIFEYSKKINIDYFKQMVESLGTKFDGFIYESEAGDVGKKIVLENTAPHNYIFKRSECAVIYVPDESRKDISTSVFINSEGNPTYLAKDIGLLDLKFKKYSPLDFSIYVVDSEQTAHFKSVFDAAGKINKEWQEKSIHISHGRMTFKGQKMSSRLGGVPSGEEVISAVYEDVKERSDERINDLNKTEKEKLQKEIALSALRISILRSKPGVNIDFDPERASSFEGDSGPYLCYTHARCSSLLGKAKEQGLSPTLSVSGEVDKDSTRIERKVLQFKYILKQSGEEIAPQKLVKYLFELAGEFNSFYATTKIIDDKNSQATEFNLYLTKLVKDTLKEGMYILGINAPEKM